MVVGNGIVLHLALTELASGYRSVMSMRLFVMTPASVIEVNAIAAVLDNTVVQGGLCGEILAESHQGIIYIIGPDSAVITGDGDIFQCCPVGYTDGIGNGIGALQDNRFLVKAFNRN